MRRSEGGIFQKAMVGTLATLAGLSLTLSGTALAAESQTSFIAHYQHNAQIEANLLVKAQAESTTNDETAVLKTEVNSLNQQVLVLYATEQALANAQVDASKRTADDAILSDLAARRAELVTLLKDEENLVRQSQQDEATARLKIAQTQFAVTRKAIAFIDANIHPSTNAASPSTKGPHNDGLADLQGGIYRLQAAAIYNTGTWLAQTKSTSHSTVASITGLVYAKPSISVPSRVTAPGFSVTNVVAAQPMVKDQDGNILADEGTYSLSSPPDASGVTVDAMTGTVFVHAGATSGVYTITYTEGSSSTRTSLIISAQ